MAGIHPLQKTNPTGRDRVSVGPRGVDGDADASRGRDARSERFLTMDADDASLAELGGMSSPSPFARGTDARCERTNGDGANNDAAGGRRDDARAFEDETFASDRRYFNACDGGVFDATSTATPHDHAASLAGARYPAHRRDSIRHFLRARETTRFRASTSLRPGVRDFVSDGRNGNTRCGIVRIVPPHVGDGSPPFVVKFCDDARRRGDRLLAVADEEGIVTIVDASKPLPGMEIEPGYRPAEQWFAHDNAIFDVAWCHRDDRLLTASGDQSVKLWDVETNVCHRTFKRHNGSVKAVSVRPDGGCGDVFASCGRDGTIALWDARESRRRGRRGVGTGAASDPYARETPTAVIARAHEPPAAMGGGTARGFRTDRRATRSATRAAAAAARGGGGGATAAAAAAAAAEDRGGFVSPPRRSRHLRVERNASVPGATGRASSRPRGDAQHGVTSVVFSHDGQVLVSAGAADGKIKLWDVRRLSGGVPVDTIVDADPPFIAGGRGDRDRGWFDDARSPDDVDARRARARRRGRGVTALALAPEGSSRVAAAYSDSHLAVFDLHNPSSGAICHLRGHRAPSFYVKATWSPCGTHVASGSCDQRVYVWRVDTPRAPPTALKGHDGEVTAVDWCPGDFTCLASCADDYTARVWTIDRQAAEEARERAGETTTTTTTWSGNGNGNGAADDAFEFNARDGMFRTPAATTERALTAPSTRKTASALTGGEWIARAIEEGRKLQFEDATRRDGDGDGCGGAEATFEENDKENADANVPGVAAISETTRGFAMATPASPALLTPGQASVRTRRVGARRREPRAQQQSNSILTYFTPRRGEDGGDDGMAAAMEE